MPSFIALSCLAALSIVPVVVPQAEDPGIFQRPQVFRQVRFHRNVMVQQLQQGNERLAIQAAAQIRDLTPDDPQAHLDLGRCFSAAGKLNAAIQSLEIAIDLGFHDAKLLQEAPELEAVRGHKLFPALVEKCESAARDAATTSTQRKASPINGRIATVSAENTRWSDLHAALLIEFQIDPQRPTSKPATRGGTAEDLVRTWYQEGTAAGHHGDLYDNLDRGHSRLPGDRFPQLAHVRYSPAAQAAKADWTIQPQHLFNRPTLGNSSTAMVGSAFWRSNPRTVMVDDLKTKLLYNQYVHNHLYAYPEHNDYDAPRGDVYPANFPFCVISQGSSGSDQPFLDALALTMAAFRPATKSALVQRGQLMSTVQMILRRCLHPIETDEDYLTGRAHPIVFLSADIDKERMVRMAHDMQPDNIPPLVQLRVVEEDLGIPGRDYFHHMPAERLFDTPAAIARVYRTTAAERRMIVDASSSSDPNGRPIEFHWKLLQGDPELVTITPMNASRNRAEIVIKWHPTHRVDHRPEMFSNRVDIGVFTHNGEYFSAPAFVTSFTLANEQRVYDDNGRIQSVDYGSSELAGKYVDPLIDIPKKWKDEYQYTDDGLLTGWTRYHNGRPPQKFNYDGTLIVSVDSLGRASVTRPVTYTAEQEGKQPPTLKQQSGGPTIRYDFASDQDLRGTVVPRP